jgi:Protein of unknown function (DUF1573).
MMMWIRSSAVGLVIVLAAVAFESCERTKNKVETTLENKGQARMVFNTKNNTFGDVKQDEVVGINYRFINEGDAPLIINKIEKGCGCTEVKYPKSAIQSRDSGIVEIIFDSAGFSGKQFKSVMIYCNDPKSPIQLNFSANVISEY